MLKEVWRAWQNVDGITDNNNNNSATLVPFTNSPSYCLPLLPPVVLSDALAAIFFWWPSSRIYLVVA